MKKKAIAAILLTGCFGVSFAQTDVNTTDVKKEKKTDQYIGVQVNGLIQQIFNINSNNTSNNANTNPYLLTYSINSRKSGWGLRLGVGYNYNAFSTNDGITNTNTNINDIQLRLGAEKVFRLSKKWSTGAGLDLVYNNNDDHTTSIVNASPGSSGDVTDTKSTSYTYGGGPQGWLRYDITDRVVLGTEASFYYVTGSETKSITVIGFPGGGGSQPDQTSNISHGTFNSPIVLFLHVKF